MKTKQKALIALILYAATLAINFLGANGWINGMTQKEVSDKYPTLLTPEPIAFAIWGLIYITVLITLVWIIKDHEKPWATRAMDAIAWPFYISCFLNMAWIVTFSFEMLGISALLTFLFAVCLAILVQRLKDKRQEPVHFPAFTFGVYAGWCLIASVLNISAWLVKIRWDGFHLPDVTWALIVLIVAGALAAFNAYRLRNAAYPLPVAWAYLHVGLYHANSQALTNTHSSIQWVALLGAMALVVFGFYVFMKNDKGIFPRMRYEHGNQN